MKVTLTGRYTGHELCRTTNGSVVESSSSRVGYTSSGSYVRCYVPGGGEAFDDTLRGTLSDAAVTLRLTVATESATTTGGIRVDVNGSQVWNSLEPAGTMECIETRRHVVKSVESGDLFGKYPEELEYTITGSAAVTGMLEYGFSLVATGQNNAWLVYDAVLEVTGESSEAPPVIAVDTGYMQGVYQDGVYYHPAGDTAFRVAVQYSQELGVAMQYIRYTIKPDGGSAVSGQTTDLSFAVDKSLWAEIPAAGSVEITAVSAHGIPSGVLILPWVITHYDIRVRTPVSGSILQTGEDVALTWDLVIPDGMPSAPAPTRYTIWPAWDDDESYQVAYAVTERTYTIPADSFAGHTKLKLLILDEYGSVVRRQGDGRLIMLYLQPSASVSGITVSTEHASGKFTPLLTLEWSSAGQTAFRVLADGFDSGAVWGADTAYTIPKIFEDGVHSIRLRIQDANGRWGEWSEPVFVNVSNSPVAGTTRLQAAAADAGVRLNITASGTALRYADVLIYRNGIMIAQLPGTETMQFEYTDTGANGECTYIVRLMTTSGFYAQTSAVTIDATPGTDGILLDDGEWIPLRYTKEFPRQYRITNREETYQRYYAGREYPVTVRSGRRSRIVNMEYIDKGYKICDRLEAVSGTVVTYKTVVGDVIRGEINMVTANKGTLFSVVGFRLTECDHTEEVPYTAGVVAYNV